MRLKLKSDNRFMEFLKSKRSSWVFIAALIIGVLLLSVGGGQEGGGTQKAGELEEYGAAMEARLEELCSGLEGVGRSRVMITFSSGEITLYEGSRAVGKRPPEVMAVTVLCDGAESDLVVARLVEMLSSMLGIGANRVKIMKLCS